MRLLNRLVGKLADRLHPDLDDTLRGLNGWTVVRLPDGPRQVFDPQLPALLEARRRHAAEHGLDRADQQILQNRHPRPDAAQAGRGVARNATVRA